MKKNILILFLFFAIKFGHTQNYSSDKIEKGVAELLKKVTDTAHFDYMTGKKFKSPKLVFFVNNNLTGNIFSEDPDYSDNETYSIFQKIYKKGTISDFLKMFKSENPSIRVYGFWSLIKNKKFDEAEKIIETENKRKSTVYWNSSGCTINQIETYNLMKKLTERMKKYGG